MNARQIYLDSYWYTWVARPSEVYVWKTLSKVITVTQDDDNSVCYCEHKEIFPQQEKLVFKNQRRTDIDIWNCKQAFVEKGKPLVDSAPRMSWLPVLLPRKKATHMKSHRRCLGDCMLMGRIRRSSHIMGFDKVKINTTPLLLLLIEGVVDMALSQTTPHTHTNA